MGRLREIPRTAAFAWSQDISRPSIVTGTRAGAVDADFSNETALELWDLELGSDDQEPELKPAGSFATDSRFYDLAWSKPNSGHGEGVVAGALENGSLDLWDATLLKNDAGNSRIAQSTMHSGAIKSIQFNPHRAELLASCGAKGELYISDLNNVSSPFRIGTTARADDFDSLDWNKKVPHILATGSSGGFLTVWDIKARKESLTLNNYGRKPVGAVAWNPDLATKLATAVPSDQDPLILLWDLRNSSAPERILRGHEQGILSLSWCGQDSDLLLSCGKDNRNICWNPHTGEAVGEFPIVTNWTFQTRWNPHNPSLLATASFDGKIAVQTLQNTNSKTGEKTGATASAADGEDFFAKAQTQPQGAVFSLAKPPKWLKRPVGAAFGFGGKLVTFRPSGENSKSSALKIETFVSDASVESSIKDFEKALTNDDIAGLCKTRGANASTEASKEAWKIMQTLVSESPRKNLLAYLGFSNEPAASEEGEEEEEEHKAVNSALSKVKDDVGIDDIMSPTANRLSMWFQDSQTENQSFLSEVSASKGARTNNPFTIYKGSESNVDREITTALMLGSFEKAMDICIKEERMSDAFMIAVCGGQKCIDKVQAAYFAQQTQGPNYLRLLASVVGKNLWDVVYNADLHNWSEIMATLCTFADEMEFPDLCEALGDRLEETGENRKDALFCYLAGSKLEKVVPIWIEEMQDTERSRTMEAGNDSEFTIHVQSLQYLIEKVSIFRSATKYEDKDGQAKTSDWKLASLYVKYAEYADAVASLGHLSLAERYLDLLPESYPAADVAKNRVKQASSKGASAATGQRTQRKAPLVAATPFQPVQPITAASAPLLNAATARQTPSAYAPPNTGHYAPSGLSNVLQAYAASPSPYAPADAFNTGYQQPIQAMAPPSQNFSAPPPPQAGPPPPKKNTQDGSNWNDLPDGFTKLPAPSRRGTPAYQPPAGNNPYAPANGMQPPMAQPPFTAQKMTSALPPPPKGSAVPSRVASPLAGPPQSFEPPSRPASSAANAYAPPQTAPPTGPPVASYGQQPPPSKQPTQYNAPPSAPPPSNRYAPAPGSIPSPGQPGMPGPPGSSRPIAPHPSSYGPAPGQGSYAPPPAQASYAPPQVQASYGPPQVQASYGPPQTIGSYASPQGGSPLTSSFASPPPRQQPPLAPPPSARPPPTGPPPRAAPPQSSRPSTAQSSQSPASKFPAGDRTHIPAESQSIFEILNAEMQRVKVRAPVNFKAQVEDTERRLNVLFDQLNNGDITNPESLQQLRQLAQGLQERNIELAQAMYVELESLKQSDQRGPWLPGLKRLVSMSKVTPP